VYLKGCAKSPSKRLFLAQKPDLKNLRLDKYRSKKKTPEDGPVLVGISRSAGP